MCQRLNTDQESGQRENVELTSIRVDEAHPPENEYEMPLPPPSMKTFTMAYTLNAVPGT